VALKAYKKKLEYSYSLGIFPTIELLQTHPEKVISILLASGAEDTKGISEIKKLCDKHKITYDIADKAIARIAIKEKTQVAGAFEKYTQPLIRNEHHVVLVNPSLPGNVGTIIRTMVGFGITNLALIRPCIDFFDPMTVRAAMGAGFKANFEYFLSFDDYRKKFSENTIYPFVLNGKNELKDVIFKKPATLLFGNEGSGLHPDFNSSETSIRISHSNEIESLNLSTAAGLALYSLYNQH